MQNLSKTHEKNVQNASHAENVGNILDNVENVPFALRGATVKTILYFLFSFVAAAELTAALSFYTMSMGASMIIAAVFCGVLAFGFHALLHGILSDTAKGIVFGKKKESGAMSNEVTGNIILSIVLLAIASGSVFFIGKKGFTAYRSTQFEQKAEAEKAPPTKQLDPSVLAGKNGKVAAWKLEALTDLAKAQTKATEATQAKDESSQARYDATTATITDIVGASAFLIELLLALLAYSIATAKLAAVYDEIARRNGASKQDPQQATTTGATATNTAQAASQQASPTATANEPNQQAATPTNQKKGITQRFNEYTVNDQNAIAEKLKNDLEGDMFYFSIEQIKAYLSRVNGLITTVSDATHQTIKFHSPIVTDEITTAPIEPPTAAPITPNLNSFSDNKANDGRAVIKGFQQQPKALTANNEALTANKQPLTAKSESKLRVCLYCEKEFIYRTHNQKFCGEECRICAWNEKLGKQLRETTSSVNGK